MRRQHRLTVTCGLVALIATAGGCASGGGGGGGGGGGDGPDDGTRTFNVDTGDAGAVDVTAGTPAENSGPGSLTGQTPGNPASGSVSVQAANVQFIASGAETMQGMLRQADISVFIAPDGEADPCSEVFEVLSFSAEEDDSGNITVSSASASLDQSAIDIVAGGNFVFCFQVIANFAGTVVVETVDITLAEGDDGPDDGDFFTCTSPDGADDGITFADPGTTRIFASTLGEGRHMLIGNSLDLAYDFDQPVRACAVIPDHFELTNLTTGEAIPLAQADLQHEHITEDGGRVRSRIAITLPGNLPLGDDFELVISARGLSLDGEFQVNGGTNLAANGTLPSGNSTPGGDFVQLFHSVQLSQHLSGTGFAGEIKLDTQDRLYFVSEEGLFGPFTDPAQVVAGDELAPSLPRLADRFLAISGNDRPVVKEGTSSGPIFEVDPTSGLATEIAVGLNLDTNPKASALAPAGYASIEMAGVDPADILVAEDGGINVLDLAAGTDLKGGINLTKRDDINSAYLTMWNPPVRSGHPAEVWGAHKPVADEDGFRIQRILPNGIEDEHVLPAPLFGFDGTSATHLQDVQGRREYLLLGNIRDFTEYQLSKQILPGDFDGIGAFIWDATRKRLQVLAGLNLEIFGFTLASHSQVVLTSDFNRAYISLPIDGSILALDGLSNDNPDEDWPCDSVYDMGVDFGVAGGARAIASTFGVGQYVVKTSPTVVQFEFDQPLPYCDVNAGNVTLTNLDTSAEVALDDLAVKRYPVFEAGEMIGSRVMIDLPDSISDGTEYELTLSGSGLGIDGEFSGTFPSGDGTPGGDFVQRFFVIEGSKILTETRNATGLAVDADGRLFIATQDQPFGPFDARAEVSEADALGDTGIISGDGRAITVDADGNLIVATRSGGLVLSVDPGIGAVETLFEGVHGSFEIDAVVLPEGFAGETGAEAGDIVVINSQRGTIAGKGEYFSDPADVGLDWQSFSVPPADLAGPAIYGAFQGRTGNTPEYTILSIVPDGTISTLFDPIAGLMGFAGIRLPDDAAGNARYLIVSDFEQSSIPNLPTRQLRGATDAHELLIYNAGTNQLSMLAAVSRGFSFSGASSSIIELDLAFTPDVNTVYVTQPSASTVIDLTGFNN